MTITPTHRHAFAATLERLFLVATFNAAAPLALASTMQRSTRIPYLCCRLDDPARAMVDPRSDVGVHRLVPVRDRFEPNRLRRYLDSSRAGIWKGKRTRARQRGEKSHT
jgi:hypothetical protein